MGKWTCNQCNLTFTTAKAAEEHGTKEHGCSWWYVSEEKETWDFGVEPKLYFSSNHISKIDGPDDASKQKTVKEWIAAKMKESGIKPVPRFSLAEHAKTVAA